MAHSDQPAQVEPKLDQTAAPVDNVSAQSSQIWSTSLESWNKTDKDMSPWKDADVGNKGFASDSKLLGNLFKDQSTKDQSTKDGNTLDMSVPIDGAKTLDGEPKKNAAQNGVEAVDGAKTLDGQPKKNAAQNGVEAVDGAKTLDGQPKKNAAQNGVEAVDGAKTLDGEPKKNAAQNGVEAVDGAKTLDGEPKKNAAQNGVEAVDGAKTLDGQPKKNAAQNGVEAVDGAKTLDGQPKKNAAQNGVEAVDGAKTLDGQPKKNAAQNGIEEQKKTPEEQKKSPEEQKKSPEEQKKSPEEQKKADDQKKAEEQKLLEGAMFDKSLNSEQKLAVAQELVKRGVTNVSGVDDSGAKSSLRLETVPAGDREMVHVFSSTEGGKEKTALRGMSNPDGSWEQQRNPRGNFVPYEGKGAADLAGMKKEGPAPEKPEKPSEPKIDNQVDPGKRGAPRKEGEAPRKEGEAPRKEGEAPRKEGEAPRKEGEAPRKEGEAPRKEGEAPRKEGEAPRKEGELPKEGAEKVEKKEDAPTDKKAELNKMFDDAAKQAKGKVGRLVKTDQGIYVKSNFDVDVDGSPRAKQIDPDGRPDTSMQFKNGRYVNAEEVPYMVLPRDQFKKFGAQIGDMALVRDTKTGNIAAAVFADAGPPGKTGEGSINLGKEGLGLKITPTSGIDENRFEYLVKPGTSQGTPKNQAELLQRIDTFKRQMGLIK